MSSAFRLAGISKSFAGRAALRGASLDVRAGEVHALCGENGAGKSTLLKVLAGMLRQDGGRIELDGEPVGGVWTPARAIHAGIGMVHQHFMLVPTLSVADNVFLGHEPRRGLLYDRARAEAETGRLAEQNDLPVDPRASIGVLSVGERQRVEILKLLARGARILVLDEPTAVLGPAEAAGLFRAVRRMVSEGRSAVVVTHKLDEVAEVADRVTVLRAGETVALLDAPIDRHAVARAMFGEEAPATTSARSPVTPLARVRLSIKVLSVPRALNRVSFEVRAGEIVGVAGVEGNGQRELALAIAGLCTSSGRVCIDEADVSREDTARRLARGLSHIAEDRHARALALGLSVAENHALGHDRDYGRVALDRGRLQADSATAIAALAVDPPDPELLAGVLSGGNQQKVVVARELRRPPAVLLACQPTRGIDQRAASRVHARILEARSQGSAVLLVSSDLDELRALSDRLLVLYRGGLVASLPPDVPLDALGRAMTGAT